MPTYDYECPKGHTFELFQKMSDEPVAKCPECGAKASRKISGGAGFLFKGEGFYITDYRSDDYRKKASAEKGDSLSDSGGSTGASSSKDAASAASGSNSSEGGSKSSKTSTD
jgi:putative FmdB family regulatory protein